MNNSKLSRIFLIIGLSVLGIPVIGILSMIFLSGFAEGAGMIAAFLIAFLGPWLLGIALTSLVLSFVFFVMARPGSGFERWKPFLRIALYLLIILLFFIFLGWVSGFDFGNEPINLPL